MQTLLYFARIIRSFTVDFELFLLPKSRKYRHGTGRRCLLFYRREIGTHGHAHNLVNHYYNRNNRSGRIRPQRETTHVFDVSSPERRFGGSAKANSPVMKSGKISAEAELPMSRTDQLRWAGTRARVIISVSRVFRIRLADGFSSSRPEVMAGHLD